MKILVTGANGYLGQGVVKALLDNGHNVVATDFKTTYVDDRAEKVDGDLFSVEEPYIYFGKPDVLLHLAWRDGFVHYSENHIADGVVFVHVITLGSDGRARGRIAHFDGAAGFLVHPVQIGLGVRNFRLNLKNVCTDSIGKIFSNLCGNAAGGEVSNKSFAHDKCTSFD